jgi:hypothetical protein
MPNAPKIVLEDTPKAYYSPAADYVHMTKRKAKRKGRTFGRPARARAKSDKIRELSAEGLNKKQIPQRPSYRSGLRVSRFSVMSIWTISSSLNRS